MVQQVKVNGVREIDAKMGCVVAKFMHLIIQSGGASHCSLVAVKVNHTMVLYVAVKRRVEAD